MLGLHHEAQKVASYRSFAPIEWSESLRSWCVFDPEFMVAIMKSPDFVVVDFVAEYAKLEQRTHIGWSGLVDALNWIPRIRAPILDGATNASLASRSKRSASIA